MDKNTERECYLVRREYTEYRDDYLIKLED